MKKIIELIKELSSKNFYGTLTINFRDGKITVLDKSESIRIDLD